MKAKSRNSRRARCLRAAAKSTNTIRHVAATKSAAPFKRSMGKFGAASDVRIIKPEDVE